jgi:small subunit ribosomal protein S17
VVAVESLKRHRLYGRSMRRTKKYHAHDEENRCKVGDKVIIAESRPLSKTKRWRVRQIIGHDVLAALPKIDESDIVRSAKGPSPVTSPEVEPPTPGRPRAAADEAAESQAVAHDEDEGER